MTRASPRVSAKHVGVLLHVRSLGAVSTLRTVEPRPANTGRRLCCFLCGGAFQCGGARPEALARSRAQEFDEWCSVLAVLSDDL